MHGATSQRAVLFKKDCVRFPKEAIESLAFYQTHDKVRSAPSSLRRAGAHGLAFVRPQKVGRHLPCKVRCKNCGTLIADEGRK